MKFSTVALFFLFFSVFSGFAFAANGVTTFSATVLNATVNSNTTYNVSFIYTSQYTTINSFDFVFPFDTRFNQTCLGSQVQGVNCGNNVTSNVSGSVANWTVNGTLRTPANTSTDNSTISILLTGGSLTVGSSYYFSFILSGVTSPRSANGSTVYNGFALMADGYTANGTRAFGGSGNTTNYTLVPLNATNVSVSFGSGQTLTANTSTASVTGTYNLTALVTDTYGNPYSGQQLNFTSLNTTASANLTLSMNGSSPLGAVAGGWYSSLNRVFTNSTGQANVSIMMGQDTLNSTSTVYQVRVFNASTGVAASDFPTNATFNITPQANTINYYILTPSSPNYYDTPFNILVHSYDAFHNINSTSSWSGLMHASAGSISLLTYSTDGSSYSTYGSAISRTLSSGNATTWFSYKTTGEINFTFNDTNAASGSILVTVTGVPAGGGGGGGSSSTPTPSPSPSPSASVTPTPTPSVKSERSIGSSTKVSGEFSSSNALFILTYTSEKAFYGDLTWRLPFDYADFQEGVVSISPAPRRVIEGSLLATWENLDLKAGGTFVVTISVSKALDQSVMQQFAAPSANARARPSATPTSAVTATPTATPTPSVQAQATSTDYTLWLILIVLIAAGGYYYFYMRKKGGLYGK